MSKYDKKTTGRIVELIRADTYTIEEVCRQAGVSTRTFYRWQEVYPDFAQLIGEAYEARRQTMVQEAKKSLLKKIQGYEVTETRTVTIPNPMGAPTIKEMITTKKHVQPDTAAIIFTLTNADPKNWRNRHSTEVTGRDGADLFSAMTDEELERAIEEMKPRIKPTTGGAKAGDSKPANQ